MRSSSKTINKSLQQEIKRTLQQALVDISTIKEAHLFLSDFFKESEYETFAKRLAVAYWLKKGRSYTNIKKNLQVSSATIASVQQILDTPGMKQTIERIEADEWAEKWSERFKKITRR